MKTTREKIEVMEAHERGEKIEVSSEGSDWKPLIDKNPWWDWFKNDYRVKPKKTRMWIWAYEYDNNKWRTTADFYSDSGIEDLLGKLKRRIKIESTMIEVEQ